MINVIICGVNGRMGQTVASDICRISNMKIIAGVDIKPDEYQNPFPVYTEIDKITANADVIIDFSSNNALSKILGFCKSKNIGVVLATTGYTKNEKELIHNESNVIPIFYSANMSLGVNLQILLAKKAAEILHNNFDIEIIETHHRNKADAPSGTALMMADKINDILMDKKEIVCGRYGNPIKRNQEIGIHAVRGGSIVGEHSILFLGPDESLEIKHCAYSKQVFSQGAICAAKFLCKKSKGLYDMDDLLSQTMKEVDSIEKI